MLKNTKTLMILALLFAPLLAHGQTLLQSGDAGYVDQATPYQAALLVNETDTAALMFAVCYHSHDQSDEATKGGACRVYDQALEPGDSVRIAPLSVIEGRQRFYMGAWVTSAASMVTPKLVDGLRAIYSEQVAAFDGQKTGGNEKPALRDIVRQMLAAPGASQGSAGHTASPERARAILDALGTAEQGAEPKAVGPQGKAQALDPDDLGFQGIFPGSTCTQVIQNTQPGSTVQSTCNHRAYCATNPGVSSLSRTGNARALAVGLQARTNCLGNIAYAYSTAQYRALVASASVRTPIGFNAVPPAYSWSDCTGLVIELGGGASLTGTCNIFGF